MSAILDICESEPNLLRRSFSDLYILMSKIMGKRDFADESLRELGFEIIITLTERIPKLLEKDQNWCEAYFFHRAKEPQDRR